jgi:hypothetical protein
MKSLSLLRRAALIAGIGALAITAIAILSPDAEATGSTSQVLVVNPSSSPVPITGSVTAAESGPWTVGVNGEVRTRPAVPPTQFQYTNEIPVDHNIGGGYYAVVAAVFTAPQSGGRIAVTSFTASEREDSSARATVELLAGYSSGGVCNAPYPIAKIGVPADGTTSSLPLTVPLIANVATGSQINCLEAEYRTYGGTALLDVNAVGFTYS